MLSADVIREVRRMLDEDEMSQRAVAVRLKVSRGTVWAVANGRRGIRLGELHLPSQKIHASQHLPERCPGCGGFVFMPCRLCAARAFAERREMLATINFPPRKPQPPQQAA
jgi:hypothetical protein